MRNLTGNVVVVAASLAPLSASAHPGPHRDEMAWVLVHALTNADHSLVIGAGLALAAWIAMTIVLLARPERAAVTSRDKR
jgi:hydrogenase/urease accessory protein HupE